MLNVDVNNDESTNIIGVEIKRLTLKDKMDSQYRIIMKRWSDVSSRSLETYMNDGHRLGMSIRLLIIPNFRKTEFLSD